MKNVRLNKKTNFWMKTYSFTGIALTPMFLTLSSEFDLFLYSLLILPPAIFLIILCKLISPVNKTVTTILCFIVVLFTLSAILGPLFFGMLFSSCQGMPG